MPLALHPSAENKMREALLKGLPNVKIEHNQFIHPMAIVFLVDADQAFAKAGKATKEVISMIGDSYPFYNYIIKHLSDLILENCDYKPGTSVSLTDIPIFNDVPATVDNIISSLKQLPVKYTIYIPFNDLISKLFGSLQSPHDLAPGIHIVSGQTLGSSGPALTHPNERRLSRMSFQRSPGMNALFPRTLEWERSRSYLAVEASGCVDVSGTFETFNQTASTVKAFYGTAIALGIMEHPTISLAIHTIERQIVFRNQRKNKNTLEYTVPFHEDLRGIIHNARPPHELLAELITPDPGSLSGRLNKIGVLFKNHRRYERTLRAAAWFCDSFSHQNRMLSFIQKTVCLEILLGDPKIQNYVGIGKLLASRCAYLISEDFGQREAILKELPQIYKLRSTIVHEGSRLTAGEARHERRLTELVSAVLRKEIELAWMEESGGSPFAAIPPTIS